MRSLSIPDEFSVFDAHTEADSSSLLSDEFVRRLQLFRQFKTKIKLK